MLRHELEQLHREGRIAGELVFLDSMLHMNPPLLESTLREALKRDAGGAHPLVLVYGDCSARMLDLVRQFRVGRADAINCAQFLLGKKRYRELMREEAFLVLPEWGTRWEEVMKDALGPNPVTARGVLQENRGVLVYLDTGVVPVPHRTLADFSAYSGLPCRVETVTLETALAGLLEAQARALAAGREERT